MGNYEKAIQLLEEIQEFHITRHAVVELLDKKSKSTYSSLMNRIYMFLRKERDGLDK